MEWTGIKVRIDWMHCTRRRWPVGRDLPFSALERCKPRQVLLYWWAGRGERQLPDGWVSIRAGHCHWSRPGWAYTCQQSQRHPLGVTALHFDLIDRTGTVIALDALSLPPERLVVRLPKLVDEVSRWIAELALEHRAGRAIAPVMVAAANDVLRGLLMMLDHDTPSQQAASQPDQSTAWRQLTTHIHQHLHDLDPVSELARRAGYTRSHFSRLFKSQTGLSPQQYIINARLALAKDLLEGTSLRVAEVATRAGYRDVFQFSRQFKRYSRLTPSAYRGRVRS